MGPKKKKNKQSVFFGGAGTQIALFFNYSVTNGLLHSTHCFGTCPEYLAKSIRGGTLLEHSNIREADGVYVFQHEYFHQTVTNCTCALANGHQNGRIFIGCYNDGNMMGYSYTEAEKGRLRSEAIAAIKDVRPAIPAKYYVMKFVPFFDFLGRPQGNTEFLVIDIRGTSNAEQRQMYKNANQDIYICTDLNVHVAKGHEIEEILQRRHQSQKHKLINDFNRKHEKLQDEKRMLEDNLKQNTELLQRKKNEFEVSMQKEAEMNQRDDTKNQFERDIEVLEEIVERQKKELEDKQDAFKKVMLEIGYAKASDDLDNLDLEGNDKKGEESEEENDGTRSDEENGSEDRNEQENGSEDSIKSSSGQKKSQLKSDKEKRKKKRSAVCVVA